MPKYLCSSTNIYLYTIIIYLISAYNMLMALDIQFLRYDIHGMELALQFKWVQNSK